MPNMPGLRGTQKKVYSASKSIDYKLLQLQRQVNSQKPSIETYRASHNYTTTGLYTRIDRNLTNDFKNATLYSDVVLGDRFRNHLLRLNLNSSGNMKQIRVVVYYSKRPGTAFSPSADDTGFNQPADPAAHKTLFDRTFVPNYSGGSISPQMYINLKNWITIVNRTSDTIEKGELHVMVMALSTLTNNPWSMNCQHFISDR